VTPRIRGSKNQRKAKGQKSWIFLACKKARSNILKERTLWDGKESAWSEGETGSLFRMSRDTETYGGVLSGGM